MTKLSEGLSNSLRVCFLGGWLGKPTVVSLSGRVTDFEKRFGGIARLYGAEGLARLSRASVCVVGLGGVGSWTVEALARSGVGKLTLVDLDDICVSNVNRQLPAVEGDFGRPKVVAMARRARAINPDVEVREVAEFFSAATADSILADGFDHVVDAIDALAEKALLIVECGRRSIPIITSGGAGGRRDGTAIRIADLAEATHDRLLQKLRKLLRSEHGFPPSGTKMGIPCVYSPEMPQHPEAFGSVCEPGMAGVRRDCNSGYGSASHVTGEFGLAAAGWVIKSITGF